MRTLLKATLDVKASNKAILNGSLSKVVEMVMGMIRPESAYFMTIDGCRSCMMFFDLKDPSMIPSIAEPFFLNFNAKVEFFPVMNADDLQKGISLAMENGIINQPALN